MCELLVFHKPSVTLCPLMPNHADEEDKRFFASSLTSEDSTDNALRGPEFKSSLELIRLVI